MQGLGYPYWNSGSPLCIEVTPYSWGLEGRRLTSKKVNVFLGTKLIISRHQTVIVARIPEMVYISSFSIYSLCIISLWLIAGSKNNG